MDKGQFYNNKQKKKQYFYPIGFNQFVLGWIPQK